MHRINLTSQQARTLHDTGTLDLPRPSPCPASGQDILIAVPLTLITDIIDQNSASNLTTATIVRYPWHTGDQDTVITHHSAHHQRVASRYNDSRVDQHNPNPIPAAELPGAYVHHRAAAQRIPGGLRLTSLTLHADLTQRINDLRRTYTSEKRALADLISTLGPAVTAAQLTAFEQLP